MLRYTTDRARPGLVGLYDIWPGNGADIFLQPRTRTGPVYSGEAAKNYLDIWPGLREWCPPLHRRSSFQTKVPITSTGQTSQFQYTTRRGYMQFGRRPAT